MGRGRRRKYGRPNSLDMLWTVLVNLVVGSLVLGLVFKMFGAGIVIGQGLSAYDLDPDHIQRLMFYLLLPGSAVGFSAVWYWLILIGRSRGVNWGGAILYGISVAFVNVPFSGLLVGLLYGNAFLAFMLALVSLLLIPSLFLAMVTYGIFMGLFNGWRATRYISDYRSR